MQNEPIVMERIFNAPVEKVWGAISDKEQIKQWSFDMKDFTPEVGCEFSFYGDKDEKTYKHLSKVMEVIPNKKLTYSWRYEGFEGNSFVTFELFPEGDKTRLVLTHAGLETFPASNGDFAKENFVKGWTHIIGTSLKTYVEA